MNARGILLSGLLLLTHTASAGDKVNYHRGNAGLQAFSVTVNNQGPSPPGLPGDHRPLVFGRVRHPGSRRYIVHPPVEKYSHR